MKKNLLVIGLICVSLFSLSGQEICDNGIDDDGDGLIDLNDIVDCNCDAVSNFLPNPSFEKMTNSCNITLGNMNCCESWIAGNVAPCTPDYCNLGGFGYNPNQNWASVRFQQPAPDGTGVVIIISNWSTSKNYEYIATCLLTPFLAGVTYTFEFSTHCLNEVTGNTEMALFGSTSCPVTLNSPGYGCLDHLTNPNWTKLGSAIYTYPANTWINQSFNFTPTQDIYSIQIGVPCDGTPSANAFHLDNLKAYENKPRIISLNQTSINCDTNKIKATADPIGGNFQWYLNGVALLGKTNDSILASDPGLYSVSYNVGGANCVKDTVTLQIKNGTSAMFSYSSTNFCQIDPNPTPTITSSTSGSFAISNPGIINAASGEIDINASGVGNFTVTHITNGSCPDTATFMISITSCEIPVADFMLSDSSICASDCISFTDLSINASNYEWIFNGGIPSSANTVGPHTICFDTPGVYDINLIATNSIGSNTISYQVNVLSNPTINAGNDMAIKLGQSTTLTATGSNGYIKWTPPTWLDCPTCPTTLSKPKETITYTATLVDSNGCVTNDDVTIIVDFDIVIFVPNIFSPNGDGNNDILYVRGSGIKSLSFLVYDRWGEKVFETENLNKGWDGIFKGKKMNNGVFAYYLKATFIDGTETEQKGDITLVK